jgi:hypothetical protein
MGITRHDFVIPAQAGIEEAGTELVTRHPGLRRGDGGKERLGGTCVSACKNLPKRLRRVIDIWPDNVAVSPSLICQAHVQTLPNIDERIQGHAHSAASSSNALTIQRKDDPYD